jgi:hypothetical protein
MFECEKRTYQTNLPYWLSEHEGKWVVIHQDRVLGMYATHREGYYAAASELDEQPFLLRQVAQRARVPVSV